MCERLLHGEASHGVDALLQEGGEHSLSQKESNLMGNHELRQGKIMTK